MLLMIVQRPNNKVQHHIYETYYTYHSGAVSGGNGCLRKLFFTARLSDST
jgi:hypothetical protein